MRASSIQRDACIFSMPRSASKVTSCDFAWSPPRERRSPRSLIPINIPPPLRSQRILNSAARFCTSSPAPTLLSVRPHGFGYVAQAFNLGNRGELRQRFHGAVGLVPGSQVTVAREVVAYNRN